jgi:hypothetical protein
MEADLATSQSRALTPLLFRFNPLPDLSISVQAAKILMIAALVFSSISNPGYCKEAAQPGLKKLFHLVGIPGLERDERVNLSLDSEGLVFQTKTVKYQVPYARIHRVLVLSADRRYEGRTYAAALATYGVGALLILKKHHVDTVVLDYVNERGGKMGIVLQMEISQGEVFKNQLKRLDISVEEPEGVSESLPKQQTGTGTTNGSKQ